MPKKHTFEFIKEKVENRGEKLLSKEYINAHTKLKLSCKNNHEYEITWHSFNKGCGCKICSYERGGKKQRNKYNDIKKIVEKDGTILCSKEYLGAFEKLNFKCLMGHKYKLLWNSFQQGQRCPKCRYNKLAEKFKFSYEYVNEHIEKNGDKLLSKEYKNNRKKIKIKCKNGHIYTTTFGLYKNGCRCPECVGCKKYKYKFVKKYIEKNGDKLLSKEYKNKKSKLKIRCKNGHIHKITFESYKNGHRCSTCSSLFSKSEKEIAEYIKSLNIDIIENDRSIIYPMELDIVIPEHKLAIEYCGLYWHSELYKDKNYHKEKMLKCNEAGYRLITIFEDEWLYKQEIVKNRLKYFLNLKTKRIYARKCEIREISKEQAKEFVDKYHIQGFASATIYLGAFYNEQTSLGFKIPKLVAVNTFVKRDLTYELNRFCVNNSIIGIASKFIKYFQRNYEWEKIITFADLRWSEGSLYEKIGFVKDKILDPDYSYFKRNEIIRYHKFGFRHSGMKNKLENYNPNLTEKENMLNNDYLRIYDCGKIRYIMKNSN